MFINILYQIRVEEGKKKKKKKSSIKAWNEHCYNYKYIFLM
jgi:hypothetical protein